uniref:Uncharacterized protein n=1 Tax=Aegilops tauschii subsp. strangulata TaxID=200361 RepID=A0A452Y8H4_AEGTS
MVSRGPNLNGGVIYTQFVCLKDATTCKNNFAGVQTPNCIRRTIYDVVALDYEKVTVFIDATVVARPNIHLASIRDMRTIVVERPTLEEWRRCVARGVFHSWHRSGIHA